MLGQEFVIKARPLSTEDNQEPNIYCLAKKGAFEKVGVSLRLALKLFD